MTLIKICGITNFEDAELAARFGADALGFNFYPKSPRFVTPEAVREIVDRLETDVLKVGVFVDEPVESIYETAGIANLDAIQLHGSESPEFAVEVRAGTGLEVIKAFRVSPDFQPEDVLKYEADAVLLDAYSPLEHGGTGETFDWEVANRIREMFPKIYLAGGLRPENVAEAIRSVRPYAVDVCSGVEESRGKKSPERLSDFCKYVRHGNI